MFEADYYTSAIREAISSFLENLPYASGNVKISQIWTNYNCACLTLRREPYTQSILPILHSDIISGRFANQPTDYYSAADYNYLVSTRPVRAPVAPVPDELYQFVAAGGMAFAFPTYFPDGRWTYEIAATIPIIDYFEAVEKYVTPRQYEFDTTRQIDIYDCVNLLEFILRHSFRPQFHSARPYERNLAEVQLIINTFFKYGRLKKIIEKFVTRRCANSSCVKYAEKFISDNMRSPSPYARDEYEFTCYIICVAFVKGLVKCSPIISKAFFKYSNGRNMYCAKPRTRSMAAPFASGIGRFKIIGTAFTNEMTADFVHRFKIYGFMAAERSRRSRKRSAKPPPSAIQRTPRAPDRRIAAVRIKAAAHARQFINARVVKPEYIVPQIAPIIPAADIEQHLVFQRLIADYLEFEHIPIFVNLTTPLTERIEHKN